MLRIALFTIGMTVSIYISNAIAAGVQSDPLSNEVLAETVMKMVVQKHWTVDGDQVKRTIEEGVNFGADYIIIPIGCDATDCQDAVAINIVTGTTIRLPTASHGYPFHKTYSLLVVNPDLNEWLRLNDFTGSGKLPNWLSRKMYIIKYGRFVKVREDKAGPRTETTDEAFRNYYIVRETAE